VTGPVLELSDVEMRYPDGTHAVGGVSMRLPAGEFASVVGASGCGKSTLLRIASGLMAPTRGTALNHATGHTGYVFQDATLLPWRSVRRNVELLAELHRLPRAERQRRAAAAIDRVGLGAFARHRPAALSGGMRMRASLARTLALSPRLLLLDEPFGALDELTREHLGEQLQELFLADRFAALLVTHSITEAVFLSSRVLVMSPRPGTVVAEVTVPFDYPRPPEIRFSPEFATVAARVSGSLRGEAVPVT
jgi:NitT/TauT family transport system ATP-binding protein